MNQLTKAFSVLLIPLIFMIGCSGGKMEDQKKVYTSIKDIPESTWKKLSQKHIYFGHQSVGYNILDGVRDLMKEYPQIKLNIIETTDAADLKAPALAHSRVGKNVNPDLKCSDFKNILDNGIGKKVDIASYKFCYVDIDSNTDIENLFKVYKETHDYARQRYPNLKLIHITVPLKTVQTGWKVTIKKILGKPIEGYAENIKRNLFNQKLVGEYGTREPVFDLAGIESSRPDGKRVAFDMEGKTYYAMNPDYTNDGGHLNEAGRRAAAESLLVLLANLSM